MAFDKNKDLVVITGASGFVGSRAVYRTHWDGYKHVIATDIAKPKFSLPGSTHFEPLDITDKDSVYSFLRKHKPKAIINIAALFDLSAPQEILNKVNIDGPLNFIEAGQDTGLEHLIQTSTGTVYKSGKNLNEESPTEPMEQYGKSKLEMEKKIGEYKKNNPHKIKIPILRPAVIYGPHFPASSKYGAAVALFAQYALARFGAGLSGYAYKGGDHESCYVHVDDVVRAHTFALENGLDDVYNIVDKTPVTHRQLGKIVVKSMDLPKYWRFLKGKQIPLPEFSMKFTAYAFEQLKPFLKKIGITLPLDRGLIKYMFGGDFSMDPSKIIKAGFEHWHPSSFKTMPHVIKEYSRSHWKEVVGPTLAKFL